MNMAGFREYGEYDAVGLAALVKAGEVTVSQVLDEAVARMKRMQPKLNAVTCEMGAIAREAIANQLPDGPFRGVPFMLKDLHAFYKNVPTQYGSKFFTNFIPDHDTEIVARYKAAGLNIFAKTNTPELGMCISTEPQSHGAVPNPWRLTHSAGGSSGGSAAVVAAGVIPMAHATDGAGSIRIPASCCGLVGLKPSRGRNPIGPDVLDSINLVHHVVSRTVRDSALALDATSGSELGSPNPPFKNAKSFADELDCDPGNLKIALSKRVAYGSMLDPACVNGVDAVAREMEKLGHVVEEAEPDIDLSFIAEFWRMNNAVSTFDMLSHRESITGKKLQPGDVEPITFAAFEAGADIRAFDLFKGIKEAQRMGQRLAKFYQSYDLLLTPTLAIRPFELGYITMKERDTDAYWDRFFRCIPFTAQQNLTGQPAISLPLAMSDDGLPIGIQLAGPFGEEAKILRVAGQLEQAMPWKNRRPSSDGDED